MNGSYLDFNVKWTGYSPTHQGLLGSDDAHPDNDLKARDGRVCQSDDQACVDRFVHSWRVTNNESLFSYAQGESTETFTDLAFPKSQPEQKFRALAEQKCADLPKGFNKRNCLYDVSVTGDEQFAESHKTMAARTGSVKVASGASVVASSSKTLSANDRSRAVKVAETAYIEEALAAGQPKVFQFDLTSEAIGVLSETLDIKQELRTGMPHYALFGKDGKNIIKATPAVNDSPPPD